MRLTHPALALLLGAAACAPATPIRRTALVNAPSLPARTGLPLRAGELRVAGELNPLRVYDAYADALIVPDVGAPGLYVPNIQLGLSLYGAPTEGFEVGGQVRYTRLSWAEPSAVGVLPFPDGDRDLLLGGLGVRGNITLAEGLTFTLGGELNLTEVEQAVYVCRTCTGGVTSSRAYTFERFDAAYFMLPTLATGVAYRFNDYVGVYTTIAFTLGVRNTGFDPDLGNLPNDTLRTMPIFPMGAGVEVNVQRFFANATLFYPLEGVEDLELGLSLAAQAGLRF
jgi:hypothetical protein